MILRKIIEDRSAILALRGEFDRNEIELVRARAWQIERCETLAGIEQDISRHLAKAKYEIAEYNESSKHYIRGFIDAFQSGQIEKLRHHPFVPNLKDLEEAISLRKAVLIEKIHADDRVKKLEIIKTRHHISSTVLQNNEEAFVRAIAIAKQKFSDSCSSWLINLEELLCDVPNCTENTISLNKIGRSDFSRATSSPQIFEKVTRKRPVRVFSSIEEVAERKSKLPKLNQATTPSPGSVLRYHDRGLHRKQNGITKDTADYLDRSSFDESRVHQDFAIAEILAHL